MSDSTAATSSGDGVSARRVRAALRVARPRGGTVHAYARWSDPGPLAARLAELGMVAGRRRAGRRTDPG